MKLGCCCINVYGELLRLDYKEALKFFVMFKTPVKSSVSPQVVVQDVHILPLLSMALYFLGVGLAYSIAFERNHVESMVPFISHVVAYPPQSGLSVLFAVPAAFSAILCFAVRYVMIEHRGKNFTSEYRDSIKKINKAALFCGVGANISILFVLLNPVGIPWNERFDMVMTIGVPHHLGDLGAFVCFTGYVFIQTYLTYSQRSVYKQNLFIQLGLLVGVIVSVAGILFTVYPAISEIFDTILDEKTGIVQFVYKRYSTTAATCAISEWFFIGLCIVFVATFYRDFKNVKVQFYLKSKK